MSSTIKRSLVEESMTKKKQPVAVMCFSSGTGGMERSAVRLAEILSAISDVTLVCKQDSFVEKLYDAGDYPFRCETVNFWSRTFSLSMLFGVRAIINNFRINNVIFFGASELKTLYFSFLGRDLNVTVWHGTTKSRAKRDVLHQLIYSCVNYHVAISEHLARNVKEIVPVSDRIIYRVVRPSFNFSDDQLLNNKNIDNKCVNIVHIGRVASGKGQIDAVLACRGLYNEGVVFSLKIIGGNDGSEYLNELKKVIDGLPYKDSIYLEGFVEDVSLYLKDADVFLFPSLGEGMPNAFIEALHHDVVCVAYDNTVFPEFLDMGFYVHLVKNKDVDALSVKLHDVVAVIEDEKLKSKVNVELSKNYFSTEREVSEWSDILR
ncbi:MAG: glycosyltransferase family 4 protein [Gammaproteobacteria bacterium]|nr:glycosyltransferase family 4 protein [Gammaproteobacteria bacterium]